MKKKVKILAVALAGILALGLTACGGYKLPPTGDDGMAKLTYPDYPTTPSDKNSWEYIENEKTTINWYVDVSAWPIPTDSDVLRVIKEKTGITVKFTTPVDDSGQKLATMIAGGDLPDVLSVTTSNTSMLAQLAQQGYVYDINGLADRWAPTLYNHFPEDVMNWWAFGNGKTYGIPNHYYSYSDVPDEQLQPNGGMMVRKDLFDEWQKLIEKDSRVGQDGMLAYEANDGTTKKVAWQGYITTPEGFKEAARWAIKNYYGTGKGKITTALQLGQFAAGSTNSSLTWLSQFFAVPFEDAEGNYLYGFTQEGYAEMLLYLNSLITTTENGHPLISNSNFSQTFDGVGGVIAGAQAFATLVTPQDYQMHFQTAMESGYEYVSMYITNERGDAPVLADIRGYGYLMNMITLECKRPDLVIKLFDFLSSDEGQRLICFGEEGKGWEWADSEKTTIKYTEQYLADKADAGKTVAGYGMMNFDLLINYQKYDNIQPQTNNGKTKGEIYRTNLKRPLSVYSYDYNATHFVVDATDARFKTYSSALTTMDSRISQQIPKILRAKNAEEAKKLYDQTVQLLEKVNGYDVVMQMQQEAYVKAKEKLGITVAWPAYMQGYVNAPNRMQPNGDLTLYRSY